MEPSRVPLAQLPTPLHRLDRVSSELGVDLFIKRDDLTGLALGGNKARKLEYILADALSAKAEVIVTCGGVHSNFIRQLGAACARCRLKCAAAVMDLPYEPPGSANISSRNTGQANSMAGQISPGLSPGIGNPQLDRLFGVDLRYHPDGPWEQLYDLAEKLALEYEATGAKVYRVPVGGSSALGAYAFYRAAEEIEDSFDWIVTASSSGSTQTGLAYAFAGSATRVLGIASDPEPDLVNDFAALGADLAKLIDAPRLLEPTAFLLDTGFVGPGYGIPSPEGQASIEYLARTEGILLDPIYTGKAFAGLTALVRKGELTGRILFWHTGGAPSLFAL